MADKRYQCEEVASIYGVKPTTVCQWIRNKELSALKIGKRYYIRPEDLEEFEKKREAK